MTRLSVEERAREAFQDRVQPWLMACFGPMIAGDREERNHRFLEEALELVQACGCSASEAHQLVDYVYGRPVGEPAQEVGGVMVTLAALCLANDLDMHGAGETELARIWTKVEQIRAKQAAKPKHSPLPAALNVSPAGEDGELIERARLIAFEVDAADRYRGFSPSKVAAQRKRRKGWYANGNFDDGQLVRCALKALHAEATRLSSMRGEIEELRGALEAMVEEKADYMRLNKLGDPEAQHTVKRARAAISRRAQHEAAR